jgi:hypothetical protein
MGALCGYVRVPENHPDADKYYDDVQVEVHGGLTFGCKTKEGGVWFGFDCAHGWDYVPRLDELCGKKIDYNNKPSEIDGKKVWYPEDVRKETNDLAEQLAERANITET